MLVHHPNTRRDGGLAVGDLDRAAIDENLTPICAVEPIKDGHQRGFARAIFPHNPVDRAARNCQRNIFVGLHRPEGF